MKIKIRKLIYTCLILTYLCMLIDTNSIVYDVRKNMKMSLEKEESDNKLSFYNPYRKEFDTLNGIKSECFLVRIFTIHNFKSGHIWAVYSNRISHNGKLLYGANLIFTHWEIQKENNKWEIKRIYESP